MMIQPPEPAPTISRGAALQAACKFRQLFSKHFVRWETCGWVRREVREGPLELVHLAVPARPPAGSPTDNVLWERSAQLLAQGTLAPAILPSGTVSAPEPEAVLIELRMGNWLHKLVRTTSEAWGARLVEHTGPPTFWKVLLHRLQRAGTLKLSHGVPCVIDRSGPATRLEPIPCRDEKLFFKLARTNWKTPAFRFAWPSDVPTSEWTRGMLEEWYPPGVRVYVSPTQPGLWDNDKTVPRHYVGEDDQRWMHT